MTIKTKTNRSPVDVYFWLGAEGDLLPLTEKQFEDRYKQDQKAVEDYYNPKVVGEGHGG